MWFCMCVTNFSLITFAAADGEANVYGLQHDGHAGPRPQQLMPLPPRPPNALGGETGELLIPAYFPVRQPCAISFEIIFLLFLWRNQLPLSSAKILSVDKKHMDTHTICFSCSALYASLSDVYLDAPRTHLCCLLALVQRSVISSKTKQPVTAHGEWEIEEEPKTKWSMWSQLCFH